MARHSNLDSDAKAPVIERRLTRRAFGGVALGSLSSVAVGLRGVANAEPVSTTAEPDGPDHLPRRRVKVLDTEISYVDTGSGEPVVFLHGNPTWSYQWQHHSLSEREPSLPGAGLCRDG